MRVVVGWGGEVSFHSSPSGQPQRQRGAVMACECLEVVILTQCRSQSLGGGGGKVNQKGFLLLLPKCITASSNALKPVLSSEKGVKSSWGLRFHLWDHWGFSCSKLRRAAARVQG